MTKHVVIATATLGGGGAERAFINIANQLVDMGVDVKIMASGSRPVKAYPIDDRIPIEVISSNRSNKLLKIIDKLSQFRKYIKRHRQYTFISFFPDVSAYCVLASMGLNVRNIVSERNDPYTIPRKKYMKRIRNWAFRHASFCVFQTEDARNYFPEAVRAKSAIIFNPINVTALPLPKPISARKKIIIAVGRVVPQKNFGLLIKSWARLYRKHPDWIVSIYGDTTIHDGVFTKPLDDMIDKLELGQSITFKGFSDRIYEKMNEASIYISTSDFEGMSNTMLEAMAIGTPTIATDCPIGGAKAIIKNDKNGILVKVGDVNGITSALERLIEDADLREQLSNNGILLRKELNVANISSKWIEII